MLGARSARVTSCEIKAARINEELQIYRVGASERKITDTSARSDGPITTEKLSLHAVRPARTLARRTKVTRAHTSVRVCERAGLNDAPIVELKSFRATRTEFCKARIRRTARRVHITVSAALRNREQCH
ncbi:unnamed protein product, partial [Iphiclides podalirius]